MSRLVIQDGTLSYSDLESRSPSSALLPATSNPLFLLHGLCTILLPEGRKLKGSLIAKDGKIESIVEVYHPKEDDQVISAAGQYVSPGFIDPHTHISLFEDGFGDYGCNENSGPLAPFLRASDGINHLDRGWQEALTSGLTTVCVTPGSNNVIGGQACAIKTRPGTVPERLIRDPCALKAAFGDNPLGTYGKRATPAMPGTRMAIAYLLRKALLDAQEYSRKRTAGTTPRDLGLEAVEKVLCGDIPLKVHCHQANDIVTAVRIAKEFGLPGLTLDHATEADRVVDFLANEVPNAIIIQGPLTVFRGKPELRNRDPSTVRTLQRRGLQVALATDHPVIPAQFFLDQVSAIHLRTGLTPDELLPMITENAARAIGCEDRIGQLKPGYDADVVICSAPPGDPTCRVLRTIVDGKQVYENKDNIPGHI